jgi:hypothetical protein
VLVPAAVVFAGTALLTRLRRAHDASEAERLGIA